MPKSKQNTSKTQTEESKLADVNFSQSYVSLLYGIGTVVVLFLIIFLGLRLNFNRGNISNESAKTQVEQEITTKSGEKIYTTVDGDTLWSIAEKFYSSGYKWVDIAESNNLKSPGVIAKGTKLVIPSVTPEAAEPTRIAQATSPTQVPTVEPTSKPTATPTIAPTATLTPIPTATVTIVPSATLTPTPTPKVIAKATVTIAPTATLTPKPSVTLTPTPAQSQVGSTSKGANLSVGDAITGTKYTVKAGDNLWNIAVRAYGNGYKWVEIAKANNLANPRIIHSGNVFIIPR